MLPRLGFDGSAESCNARGDVDCKYSFTWKDAGHAPRAQIELDVDHVCSIGSALRLPRSYAMHEAM